MELVHTIAQLQQELAEIRSLRLGFITNFFFNPTKHELWVMKNDCMIERIDKTLFIIKHSFSFWNVFYCSTTFDELEKDLSVFIAQYSAITMSFDIVGRDMQCRPMVEMFQGKGCKIATSLVRMTRMAEPLNNTVDVSIRKATEKDIPLVSMLLHEHFNVQTEQIPYDEELCEYANCGHILICEEQGKVCGFLIYELYSSTLYLRYWFTLPDCRNKGIGSRLLRKFFKEGKDTKRQLLWVICSNENAIKRYKHYGFKEENMYDYVMQNK